MFCPTWRCGLLVPVDYAPEQRKYLYWTFFWFGMFYEHQTLIVAAIGLEVAVLAAHPNSAAIFHRE